MIARASQLFLPTLRDDPADAEVASHKLLVRGGFIRQVSAGVWTYLPLGWRVHQKVVQIIREEMNAIGAQEMLAPVLTPGELWETSGRYDLPVVFKLQDRNGRAFVLPMSHEETFTVHGKELQSYKQLPQTWYHFGTKERDEPRPRGGLLRVREFIMKDAYSFDRDEAGMRTIEDVSEFLEVDPRATAKAMPVVVDDKVVLALIRGDDRLDEAKLAAALGQFVRPAHPEEITETFGAGAGSIGPVGSPVRVLADEALREGQYIVGANRDDRHLKGTQAGRDFDADFADLRRVKEGDSCPSCGGKLTIEQAIEIGHIFKLDTDYSVPFEANFLDEDGTEKPLVRGSY